MQTRGGWPASFSRWLARRNTRSEAHLSRGLSAASLLAEQDTSADARGAIPAIVLTCDRYHPFARHMIQRYQTAWPSHPFTFHVPYQREALCGPGIVPHRTPGEIRATVLELLKGFHDDAWVYWCIDDKYPIRILETPVAHLAAAVLSEHLPEVDGLLFCRCRRLLLPEHLLPEERVGPGGVVLLRRRNYAQIWIHQFLRVKVLRTLFLGLPESIPHAQAMDSMKDRAVLPASHRLYVVQTNLAVFGESTMRGRVTRNCATSLRSLGLAVPDGFEQCDIETVMGVIETHRLEVDGAQP
jgi:hypothetical protein